MKSAAAHTYKHDEPAPLPFTTKLRLVLCAGQAANDGKYDEVGNVKFKTDANNNISTFIYDGRNLLLTESHPLAAISNYQYDEMGNRIQQEDPEHRITSWNYDVRRRLLSETNGENATTSYQYDGNGNRIAMHRPNGNTWQSTFDGANRLVNIADPAAGQTHYTYDKNNNRTHKAWGQALHLTQAYPGPDSIDCNILIILNNI